MNKFTKKISILLFVSLFFPLNGYCENDNNSTISDWFTNNGISIRKTFDGSKNESKPSAITWVNDSSEQDSFYLIDIAVKIKEWNITNSGNSLLTLYPIIEWHKNSKDSKELDKISGKVKMEYRMFPLHFYSSNNTIIDSISPNLSPKVFSPLLIGSLGFSEDLRENEGEFNGSLFLTITSNKKWYPGAQFRSPDNGFIGRYYPYLGFEHFEPTIGDQEAKVEFATGRFYAEYWPFPSKTEQFLQLIFDYTYRTVISEKSCDLDDVSELSLSLNLYLDGKGNVGIGLDYVNGEDPQNGFIDREQTSVSLKIKL